MKLDKVCHCLSLSQGCLLLGILDLAAYISVIAYFSIRIHETPEIKVILLLVGVIIGVFTCLLMIYGTLTEKCWFLLYHIGWEIILIAIFIIEEVKRVFNGLLIGNVQSELMPVIILCCTLGLGIYYWNVINNRYLEIERKQSATLDLVEIK